MPKRTCAPKLTSSVRATRKSLPPGWDANEKPRRQTMLRAILLAVACAAFCSGAAAQGFPAKPIHIVVPYPAGGTTDLMARALQEPMQKTLGQPVIVDNKPGAAGAIGAREVARSPADGYTLLFSNNGPSSTTPLLVEDAGYDGLRDFAPVSLVSTAPLFVVVNAAVPSNDLRNFIDYAKSQPKGLEYASAGIGSLGHLA